MYQFTRRTNPVTAFSKMQQFLLNNEFLTQTQTIWIYFIVAQPRATFWLILLVRIWTRYHRMVGTLDYGGPWPTRCLLFLCPKGLIRSWPLPGYQSSSSFFLNLLSQSPNLLQNNPEISHFLFRSERHRDFAEKTFPIFDVVATF